MLSHLPIFYFIFLILFICLCWVSIAPLGLSLVAASGGYPSLQCAGFSLQWLLLLRSTGSRHVGFSSCSTRAQQLWCTGCRVHGLSSCGSRALERRLSSCGVWAQLLCGVWYLPGPGLEPVSAALAGGFLTTAQPGKSICLFILEEHVSTIQHQNFRLLY